MPEITPPPYVDFNAKFLKDPNIKINLDLTIDTLWAWTKKLADEQYLHPRKNVHKGVLLVIAESVAGRVDNVRRYRGTDPTENHQIYVPIDEGEGDYQTKVRTFNKQLLDLGLHKIDGATLVAVRNRLVLGSRLELLATNYDKDELPESCGARHTVVLAASNLRNILWTLALSEQDNIMTAYVDGKRVSDYDPKKPTIPQK